MEWPHRPASRSSSRDVTAPPSFVYTDSLRLVLPDWSYLSEHTAIMKGSSLCQLKKQLQQFSQRVSYVKLLQIWSI